MFAHQVLQPCWLYSSHLPKLGLLTQRLIASGLQAGRADRKTPPCLPSSKQPHAAEQNALLASSSENKASCWAQRRERQHRVSTHPPSAPKMLGMKGISSSWSSIRLQTAPEEAALRFLSLQLARSPWDSVPEDKRRGTCSSCLEKNLCKYPQAWGAKPPGPGVYLGVACPVHIIRNGYRHRVGTEQLPHCAGMKGQGLGKASVK